jgi:hypothetical protein
MSTTQQQEPVPQADGDATEQPKPLPSPLIVQQRIVSNLHELDLEYYVSTNLSRFIVAGQ